ncbi:MAG TPA: hypothetical protein VNL38_02120 [Candidatus Nitrosotenuis sp.]|nr:hypothetical protein [Candidatus Nitrosotenuis sp.]
MSVECKDLERILREDNADEMTSLEAHAASCPRCAEELALWREISAAAPSLQKSWESPALWPRIRRALAEEQEKSSRAGWGEFLAGWFSGWRLAASVAALVLMSIVGTWLALRPQPQTDLPAASTPEQKLLTEQALREIESTEEAYRKSIEKLAQAAGPQVKAADTPLLMSYREKLIVLDSAIEELRANAEQNPFNAHLRRELLALYQEKHKTLEAIAAAGAEPR